MLPLDSPKWSELSHAYGSAADIPRLLSDLKLLPSAEDDEAEPYFSLWSALCHQGDVYTASYAAVPHIVLAISGDPARSPWTLFQLLTCIEIARFKRRGPLIPSELEIDYLTALTQIPELVARAASQKWDHWYCGAALAAVAASKGFPSYAEAILELDPDTIANLLNHKYDE